MNIFFSEFIKCKCTLYLISKYVKVFHVNLSVFLSTKYHAPHIGLNHVTMQLDGVQDFFVSPSFYRMVVYSKMIRNNWSARWWCIYNSLSKPTILVPIWCSWHWYFFYMTSASTFVCNVFGRFSIVIEKTNQSAYNDSKEIRPLINDDLWWQYIFCEYCIARTSKLWYQWAIKQEIDKS